MTRDDAAPSPTGTDEQTLPSGSGSAAAEADGQTAEDIIGQLLDLSEEWT